MDTIKVWIVEHNTWGEGSDLLSVCRSLEKAIERAEEHAKGYGYQRLKRVHEYTWGPNGDDFVNISITDYELE